MHVGSLFYNLLFCLPEFAFLVFYRNFDNSRFVDNASCSLSLFNDANNPSLVSFLFLDVLAISCSLFTWQTDQKATRGFSRMALQKLEHITAGLGYCGHLGDNGQIVNNEGHFVLLVARQRLSVAQKSKACHIGGAMSVVFVHETGSNTVQTCHGIHAALVSLTDILFTDNQFNAVPTLRLVQPLVCIDSDLGTQRFGQDEHISNDGGIRNNELVGLANGCGDPTDGTPRVHNGLTASDGRVG